MKLIVGLGNPGRRYELTRHNIGFKVVRVLADRWKIKLNSKAFQSLIGKGKIYGEEVIVALPQNFMNNSGEAVAALRIRKKAHLKDLLVICDDVNLSLGIIRIRARGSSGGHRGLDSIIEHLDTKEFTRLRIGIEKKGLKEGLSGYVLSPFNKDEVKILDEAVESAVKCSEIWVRQGTERAAHRFNVKNRKD